MPSAPNIPLNRWDHIANRRLLNELVYRIKHWFRSHWWPTRIVIAFGLPLVIFGFLRPEWYGLTPNEFDPIIYTGYAINLDDVIREVGQSWYFVTRWTAYMPNHLATAIAGPVAGRLLVRWIVGGVVVLSVLHLGRRWRWNRPTELVVATTLLVNPMFVRSHMTDYSEWFVVSWGVVLVCQCLEIRSTALRSMAVGVIGAAIAIANPVSLTFVAPTVLVYLIATAYRSSESPRTVRAWAKAVVPASTVLFGAIVTIGSGWMLFRVVYGLPNVYKPTIDYLSDYSSSAAERWRSPDHSWLSESLWIYSPIVLALAVALVKPVRALFSRSRVALALAGLLAIEYAWQVYDQFISRGLSLEIPYYWSYHLPSLLVMTATVLGSCQWTSRRAGAFLGAWVAIIGATRLWDLNLPAGWALVPIAAVTAGAVFALSARHQHATLASLAIVGLLVQVAAPGGSGQWDPRYDRVFFEKSNSRSRMDLSEVIWLENELDQLASDAGIFFLPSADASNITEVYVPRTSRRMLGLVNYRPTGKLSDGDQSRLQQGGIRQLAIYGSSDFVSATLAELAELPTPTFRIAADKTHEGGHSYRLVVLQYSTVSGGYEWQPSRLPARTGAIAGTARSAAPPPGPPARLADVWPKRALGHPQLPGNDSLFSRGRAD